jgi:hypothetical protein
LPPYWESANMIEPHGTDIASCICPDHEVRNNRIQAFNEVPMAFVMRFSQAESHCSTSSASISNIDPYVPRRP